MNVKQEILDYSSEEDKPILLWLFERYHWASEWRGVAYDEYVRDETKKFNSRRVWHPQPNGKQLYYFKLMLEEFKKTQNDFSILVTQNKLRNNPTNSGIWENQLDSQVDRNTVLLNKLKEFK
jgi:hypothetical protein